MSRRGLSVGIVGCGLIGAKRAQALGEHDRIVGCYDISAKARSEFATAHGVPAFDDLAALLGARPDVVVAAVTHDALAATAELALAAEANVLVEKPAGLGVAQIDRLIEAERASGGRRVKVGFNHRFHPALARAAAEVGGGEHGELMFLRGRYGHGGRIGYEREWRALAERSGGGELVDQGMHLLDLAHWMAGPLPLHSALLRTHFWDTEVEDNAALILGEPDSRSAPWAMLHVSWSEWKNLFSLEVYCRTAKLAVDGLGGSYGPETLRIYRMRPELGPPDLEEVAYPAEDGSWRAEWEHFADALEAGDGRLLLGDLADARYAWQRIEDAYAGGPYAPMRERIGVQALG